MASNGVCLMPKHDTTLPGLRLAAVLAFAAVAAPAALAQGTPPSGSLVPGIVIPEPKVTGTATFGGNILDVQTTDTGWKQFGTSQALAAALETGASGHYNGAVVELLNNLSPKTNALTSALVSFGKLGPESTGNQVFGHYSLAENHAKAGVAIAAEFTARNFCGDPDTKLPPNLAIGTPGCVANGLQVTSGGPYDSSLGILIGPEGGSSHYFTTGIYLRGFQQYGLVAEAPHGGGDSAWFKGPVRGADNGTWSSAGLSGVAALGVTGDTTLHGALTAPKLATTGTVSGAICMAASGQILYERGATGCTTSLRGLKRDIDPLSDEEALADLRAFKPVAFTMRQEDATRRVGFIAEEVRAADPRCATYDGAGKLQGYEPNCVLAILVKAVQAQDREIVALKRQLGRR
jgi:hypothetical protein